MCSGNGSNFENVVHSCPNHDVVVMVYNKKKAKAKKRADRLDIASCYSKDEDEIIALFDAYNIDLIVIGRVDESSQQEVCWRILRAVN